VHGLLTVNSGKHNPALPSI